MSNENTQNLRTLLTRLLKDNATEVVAVDLRAPVKEGFYCRSCAAVGPSPKRVEHADFCTVTLAKSLLQQITEKDLRLNNVHLVTP